MNILLCIDIQKEYSKIGNLPVFNYEEVVNNTLKEIKSDKYDEIILIKHVNDTGIFEKDSPLTELDPRILNLGLKTIIKKYADSFEDTSLLEEIKKFKDPNIYICGMMTQNCITYTALTSVLLKYPTFILENSTSTIDPVVHDIAIVALTSKGITTIN